MSSLLQIGTIPLIMKLFSINNIPWGRRGYLGLYPIIKTLLFTTPTVTLWSHACKYEIWGYNEKCMAWRWPPPPPEFHGMLTLNLLGLLASELSIFMNIQKIGKWSHILAFADSSSDLGWIQKSSFGTVTEELNDTVSWWPGWTLVSNEIFQHSQH